MRAPLDVLRAGGVVSAATESFFGLFVDAASPAALDALFTLKSRSQGSALVIPDRASWERWVRGVPPLAVALAKQFWPGPLTIALPAADGVDARLVVDGTVGVRVPGPSAAQDLCRAFGGALTATSANLHGQPPATRAAEVRASFAVACEREDLVVVEGHCPGGAPSTIVSVRERQVSVVREGAIARGDIEAATRNALC